MKFWLYCGMAVLLAACVVIFWFAARHAISYWLNDDGGAEKDRAVDKTALIVLCLGLSVTGSFAQSPSVLLFGRNAIASTPTLPSSVGYRWDFTNLADGAVSSWADSIAGNTWVQSTGGSQPTKDSSGVTFTSGKHLDVTNVLNCGSAGSALDAYLVIIKVNTLQEGYLIAAGNNVYMGIGGGLQYYNQASAFGSPATGVWVDYIYAGKDGANYKHYTNGVVALSSGSGTEYAGALTHIGRISAGLNFRGVMKDLIVFTNVVGLDSTSVSNIHRWATNRYNFSP